MVDFGVTDDIPWPTASETLLGSGDHWQAIANLDGAGGSDRLRASGFQRAAEVIFEEIAAGRDQDLLVYPFAFCWRHHLELELKSLIRAAAHLLGEPLSDATKDELKGHRLGPLWALCRPLLERIDPRAAADYGTVGGQLSELHQIDPAGDAFRYAITNAGKPWLASVKAGQIAVDRFHRVCEGLATFLGACADQIDYYRSAAPTSAELWP